MQHWTFAKNIRNLGLFLHILIFISITNMCTRQVWNPCGDLVLFSIRTWHFNNFTKWIIPICNPILQLPFKDLCFYFNSVQYEVFPEIDHSANLSRIVLVEYTIGSAVELNFC